MVTDGRPLGVYLAAVYDHIRMHSPIVQARYSPASQCARTVQVTIERAFQILDQLETAGLIRTVRVPAPKRGRGRIVRIEAVP